MGTKGLFKMPIQRNFLSQILRRMLFATLFLSGLSVGLALINQYTVFKISMETITFPICILASMIVVSLMIALIHFKKRIDLKAQLTYQTVPTRTQRIPSILQLGDTHKKKKRIINTGRNTNQFVQPERHLNQASERNIQNVLSHQHRANSPDNFTTTKTPIHSPVLLPDVPPNIRINRRATSIQTLRKWQEESSSPTSVVDMVNQTALAFMKRGKRPRSKSLDL